ncbi:MAG: hypothetical protein KME12_23185 [Trichocoleus desertorum ATA4-8-CV12]|nr:hypothetical protein [Trichocoleus desertorum ATA4-8-CV12]
MGKAKRRRNLAPALGFGKQQQYQEKNVASKMKLLEQKGVIEAVAEAQMQAPFDAYSKNWVCDFGNEYIAVNTLEQCLGLIEIEDTEKTLAYKQCLSTGYAENEEETWSIQWNPKRAEHLKNVYSFEMHADGSLCVAP